MQESASAARAIIAFNGYLWWRSERLPVHDPTRGRAAGALTLHLRACSAKWCGRHGELAGHGEPKVEMSAWLAAYVLGGLFMNVVKRNRELRSVRLTQGDGHVGSAKDGAAPR